MAGSVSAQGHHVRLAQRNDVRLIQYPMLVNLQVTRTSPQRYPQTPFPLRHSILDSLFAERLPRDGLNLALCRASGGALSNRA
jgi:hypothetical protein